jgi:hypothetical protein
MRLAAVKASHVLLRCEAMAARNQNVGALPFHEQLAEIGGACVKSP